jgi:hypothetical protein
VIALSIAAVLVALIARDVVLRVLRDRARERGLAYAGKRAAAMETVSGRLDAISEHVGELLEKHHGRIKSAEEWIEATRAREALERGGRR